MGAALLTDRIFDDLFGGRVSVPNDGAQLHPFESGVLILYLRSVSQDALDTFFPYIGVLQEAEDEELGEFEDLRFGLVAALGSPDDYRQDESLVDESQLEELFLLLEKVTDPLDQFHKFLAHRTLGQGTEEVDEAVFPQLGNEVAFQMDEVVDFGGLQRERVKEEECVARQLAGSLHDLHQLLQDYVLFVDVVLGCLEAAYLHHSHQLAHCIVLVRISRLEIGHPFDQGVQYCLVDIQVVLPDEHWINPDDEFEGLLDDMGFGGGRNPSPEYDHVPRITDSLIIVSPAYEALTLFPSIDIHQHGEGSNVHACVVYFSLNVSVVGRIALLGGSQQFLQDLPRLTVDRAQEFLDCTFYGGI